MPARGVQLPVAKVWCGLDPPLASEQICCGLTLSAWMGKVYSRFSQRKISPLLSLYLQECGSTTAQQR